MSCLSWEWFQMFPKRWSCAEFSPLFGYLWWFWYLFLIFYWPEQSYSAKIWVFVRKLGYDIFHMTWFLRDFDLETKCIGKCEAAYLKCTSNCLDTNCLLDCAREITTCTNGAVILFFLFPILLNLACPCQLDCPNGCSDCRNPICFCDVWLKVFLHKWFHNLGWIEWSKWSESSIMCEREQWNTWKVHSRLWRWQSMWK